MATGLLPGQGRRVVFPTTLARVHFVEDFDFPQFGQPFVEGPPLVHVDGAEEKAGRFRQAATQRCRQLFQRLGHRRRPAGRSIGEEICVFQPDQLFAAKERERQQSLDGLVDLARGLVGVVGHTVNRIDGKVSPALRGHAGRIFARHALHLGLIGTNNGANLRRRSFGFGGHWE